MKAGQTILKRLIEGERQYRVPLFQRPYTWDKLQLHQLWSDILDQYEVLASYDADDGSRPTKSSHFIGSFVLAPVSGLASGVSTYLIVDGQQRLITLLLALAALRDAQVGTDQRAVDRLNQLYLRNEHAQGLDRYKVLPTRTDRQVFFSLIDGAMPVASQSKVAAAHRFFASQLASPIPGREDEPISFQRMERVVVERLAVVDITTEDDDNPHRIFESLNATGMALTQGDLLRNYFFMLLPTRGQEIYDKVWYPMEQGLGEDRLEALARVDLQRRGIDATKDDVYRLQQDRLDPLARDETRIELEIRDLALRASHYRRMVDPSVEPDLEVRAALTRLRRWGAETIYPMLMHMYDLTERGAATTADLLQSLSYIESFLVRRHLAGVSAKQLNRLFIDGIKQLPTDRPIAEAVKWVLSGERRYWPTDQQVRDAVRRGFFYLMGRPEQRKLILERIEQSFGHLEPVNLTSANLTIEHIMPQTLSEEWRVQLQAAGEDPDTVRDELVHTLGNLTLTAYNGVLSNNPFERKRQIYGDSNLQLNRVLKDETVWGRTQILARADELANRIVEIWPPPMPGAKGAAIGFDWSRIDSAVAAIPVGRWTTYGDLALLGGTAAQAVGNRVASNAAPASAYRVLDSQGRLRPSFHWPDPSDTRDALDLLRSEGVVFGEDVSADPSQRINALELAETIDYEVDPEELDRLRRIYAASPLSLGAGGDSPWLDDGKGWHLSQVTTKTREMLEALVEMLREVTNGVEPSWNQKYYISWSCGPRIWAAAHPRQHWMWFEINQPSFTAEEAAGRLGWLAVPPGGSPSWKNEGPAQVITSSSGGVSLQLRALGDMSGPSGAALRQLLSEAWNAAQSSAAARL